MAAQASSVHEVAPVSENPHVTLVRWRVIQDLSAGERHLVGWNVEACEGRASTCVVHIDLSSSWRRPVPDASTSSKGRQRTMPMPNTCGMRG